MIDTLGSEFDTKYAKLDDDKLRYNASDEDLHLLYLNQKSRFSDNLIKNDIRKFDIYTVYTWYT